MMNLKPLGEYLITTPVEPDDKTATGIFLPEAAKEKPQQGEVVAVGPGKRTAEGERIQPDVSVGDIVLHAKYAGTEVKLDGKEYLILKEIDVLAIVEK